MTGSNLERLIKETIGAEPFLSCSCDRLVTLMNEWGEKCIDEPQLVYLSVQIEHNTKEWLRLNKVSVLRKIRIGFNLLRIGVNPFNPYRGLIKIAANQSRK
jgi:hypothetical protein